MKVEPSVLGGARWCSVVLGGALGDARSCSVTLGCPRPSRRLFCIFCIFANFVHVCQFLYIFCIFSYIFDWQLLSFLAFFSTFLGFVYIVGIFCTLLSLLYVFVFFVHFWQLLCIFGLPCAGASPSVLCAASKRPISAPQVQLSMRSRDFCELLQAARWALHRCWSQGVHCWV